MRKGIENEPPGGYLESLRVLHSTGRTSGRSACTPGQSTYCFVVLRDGSVTQYVSREHALLIMSARFVANREKLCKDKQKGPLAPYFFQKIANTNQYTAHQQLGYASPFELTG